MKSYNKLLIDFMKEKNDIIKSYIGKPYIFTTKDYKEVLEWDEDTCKQILSDLYSGGDGGCCPWCLTFRCYCCGYGKRNGDCNGSSRYNEILDKLRELSIMSIADIKEIESLINKYKINEQK